MSLNIHASYLYYARKGKDRALRGIHEELVENAIANPDRLIDARDGRDASH